MESFGLYTTNQPRKVLHPYGVNCFWELVGGGEDVDGDIVLLLEGFMRNVLRETERWKTKAQNAGGRPKWKIQLHDGLAQSPVPPLVANPPECWYFLYSARFGMNPDAGTDVYNVRVEYDQILP